MMRLGNISSKEMCEGPLFGKILRYTIPIILSGLLQLLFNAADLIVVGQFCGEDSVAAVGATGALINLIVNLFIGLSVGAGVSTARSLGSRRFEEGKDVVHTAIPIAIISGIFLTLIGLLFSYTFLTWMDTPTEVIDLASIYMKYYFCGMTGSMVYNFGAAILRAAGNTRGPLIYLTISGVINVILNVVFVVFFRMDVAGVALATAITQSLSAILVVIDLAKRDDCLHFDFRKMHVDKRAFLQMVRIGLPAGIQGSLFSISNVMIQSSVNSFGHIVMSGNSAASNIEGFVYVSMNSFHQTALNFSGQNCGARQYDRVRKVARICLIDVAVVGGVLGVLAFLFGPVLLKLYVPDSAEAIEAGLLRMSVISLTYFLCGIMDVMTGVMRGMGVSLVPMIISILGVCGVRILWIKTIFTWEAFHSTTVLYLSYPISWILCFLVQVVAYWIILKKMIRKNQSESNLEVQSHE